jgi:hypothetical protein
MPYRTLPARARPLLGAGCTQPVVKLGRSLIGWHWLAFILPDTKVSALH